MDGSFPQGPAVGMRVWTENGYRNHGPAGGPKIDIPRKLGGDVVATERAFALGDTLMFVVRWDNGPSSTHYPDELFCIGRFKIAADFESAIEFEGEIELTLGSGGGFREAKMRLCYGGLAQDVHLFEADRGFGPTVSSASRNARR